MPDNSTPSLARLDALIAAAGFPTRIETLEQAWSLTNALPVSRRFTERARRLLEREPARASDEIIIMVTLRAKSEDAHELEQAAREFVEATNQLEGALGSRLYRSTRGPDTLILIERFVDQDAFNRHMSSDYFHRFQVVQAPLLAAPVEAVFVESISE